ncbi:hypothetical protein IJG73_00730 [Candidatus Saccharibacteria bacterium]|nr:hypothetical protein [Candidatus Saccharibacteria bacterium]
MSLFSKLKKRLYFTVARYFRFFANHSLKRWHPRIVAITGSVGKTTMLHLLEAELEGKAHYSHDANSAFGISFDLLNLRGVTGSKFRWLYLFIAAPIKCLFYRHTEPFYVVEIDGERPHETEFLASWLRPEVTLWISLGRSHAVQFEQSVEAGKFKNIDKAITYEFAMLPQYTSGQIYIDGDVPMMKKAIKKIQTKHNIKAEVIICKKSDLKKYAVYPDHSEFTLDRATFHFAQPMPRDLAIQLSMLKKLTDYLGIKLKTNLRHLAMPPGRNSYFKGKKGLDLIDSSYNAHLISFESVLDMAKSMKAKHKWLVVGDMVEQGSIEGEEHTKLADAIAKVKPEQVILVGRRTQKYTAPRLEELGVIAYSTLEPKNALAYIEQNTTGKETIFFKGSQYLEWIIEKLLKNPADADRLPRREKAAVRRRLKRGLS